jgi:hypothetical protein
MKKLLIALAAFAPTIRAEHDGDILVIEGASFETTIPKNDGEVYTEIANLMQAVSKDCTEANIKAPTYHLALGNEDNDIPTTSAVISYSEQLLVINPDGTFDYIGG